MREKRAALRGVGDRAGAVEGTGLQAAVLRGSLLLLRLRLGLRHGAVHAVGRRAWHVVTGTGRGRRSCWWLEKAKEGDEAKEKSCLTRYVQFEADLGPLTHIPS